MFTSLLTQLNCNLHITRLLDKLPERSCARQLLQLAGFRFANEHFVFEKYNAWCLQRHYVGYCFNHNGPGYDRPRRAWRRSNLETSALLLERQILHPHIQVMGHRV